MTRFNFKLKQEEKKNMFNFMSHVIFQNLVIHYSDIFQQKIWIPDDKSLFAFGFQNDQVGQGCNWDGQDCHIWNKGVITDNVEKKIDKILKTC